MTDLHYQVEYAKTNRASCKACKRKIDEGDVRLGTKVQSAFHDGKILNWHHEECFFKKKCPDSIAEIANFNLLENEDKKRIKSKIGGPSGVVMPSEKQKKGEGKKCDENAALSNYSIECAKSSSNICTDCDINICENEIIVSKMGYDRIKGDYPMKYHVKCFAERKNDFLFLAGGEEIPGFKSLKKDDQIMVKETIQPCNENDLPIKKLTIEPKIEADLMIEKDLQKEIEKQNKTFHKYCSDLKDFPKKVLHSILVKNSQKFFKGKKECLDHIADMMTFGVLDPCSKCKGQLVLDTFYYKCRGNISAWAKCTFTTKNPKRHTMKIIGSRKNEAPFKGFKSKCSERVFEVEPPGLEAESSQRVLPLPPLKNLQFFLYGRLKQKVETKNRILRLGGLVVNELTVTLAAVISTKEDLEENSDKMKAIQYFDIEVVEESFLDLIDTDNGTIAISLELIKENNIAEWGSDPTIRVPQDVLDGKPIQKSGSMYVESKTAITKLKIKGGTAVDSDSGLENTAHVYTALNGDMYSVILGKTDVVAGQNSYYKLQLLKADVGSRFWLFRSWGRIGTQFGGNKLESFNNIEKAMESFQGLYKAKTRNNWDQRHYFKKVPNGYAPIEVDYNDEPAQALEADKECSLPLIVQNLLQRIFDKEIMNKTLLEFELDTEKMPLGKLSKNQIKSGYAVLSELLQLLEKGKASDNKIIDATNRFYTLVPHNLGTENPPLFNNIEAINGKTEMLDNLLEIVIAYSLLQNVKVHPIEAHYRKLKSDITPIDKKSEEFEMIVEYVKNTHASTHSNYTLSVDEVFKVVREGEENRYKPFKKLHNRRLLWHGSRVTNFAGILSEGLRIAPPEAPKTGNMFGKGIYFSDMVSKSANYCCTISNHLSNDVGLMLLSEVALGDMKECVTSEYVTQLSGAHSVWGVGRPQPDMTRARSLADGVLVPLGPPVVSRNDTDLLYSEYIVYDVAQVNVKYLIQMKFNYQYGRHT